MRNGRRRKRSEDDDLEFVEAFIDEGLSEAPPEFRQLLGEIADRQEVPRNQWVRETLLAHFEERDDDEEDEEDGGDDNGDKKPSAFACSGWFSRRNTKPKPTSPPKLELVKP